MMTSGKMINRDSDKGNGTKKETKHNVPWFIDIINIYRD